MVVVAGMVVVSHSVVFAQGAPLFAVLAGGNEVGPDGEANAGDPNGYGAATVIVLNDSDTVCFALVLDNITPPTVAHIHQGFAGQNGDIVVDFIGGDSPIEPPTSANPGAVSGCVSGAAIKVPGILTTIRRAPTNFYVNVHNGDFPAGAVRGQLY
jgi:hypothetical protein